MLVGDLIQGCREAVTDLPQVLGSPTVVSSTPVVGDNSVGTGPYVFVATFTTIWGETAPSSEFSGTIAGPNNTLQILLASASGFQRPYPVITGTNIYLGGATPGSETVKFSYPGVGPGTPITLVSTPQPTYQGPPQRNTAYLPDTDGDAINAATMFRWMNDALKLGSQVCGGLLDYGGLGSTSGVPQYITPGTWKKISSLWYDGYPLAMDDAGNFFRRNAITASILASVATSLYTDRMMLEVWPQPSRTAAQTTLSAPLAATDTQAALISTAGFLLTNGFAKIGNEIMSYSGIGGGFLKNLIRGLSGTVASAVAAGQPVQELNMFWQGWRKYAPTFQPGDSLLTVPVPVAWESQIFKYMLARAKLAEQSVGDFSKLEEDFIKNMDKWLKSTAVSTGPRQIGDVSEGLQVLENLGGGFVIP